MVDEEHEYLRERGLIDLEKHEMESRLMRELWEEEQSVRIILGKVRKKSKNEKYATVTRKFPRIISIQLNNRRLLAASQVWDRPESLVYSGVSK